MRELMTLRENEGEMNMYLDKERMEAIAGEMLVRFEEQSELVKEINREIEKAKADGAKAEEKAKDGVKRLEEVCAQIKGAGKNQAEIYDILCFEIELKKDRLDANEKNIKEMYQCILAQNDVIKKLVDGRKTEMGVYKGLIRVQELLFRYQQETTKLVKLVYDLFEYDTEMNEETNEIMRRVIEKMDFVSDNEEMGEIAQQEVKEALTTVERWRNSVSRILKLERKAHWERRRGGWR